MDFVKKTLIPVLLAIATLLTALQPFYLNTIEVKEREKGEAIVALMKNLECKIKKGE